MTAFSVVVIVVVVLCTYIMFGVMWLGLRDDVVRRYVLVLITICVIVVGVWWVIPKQDEPKEQPTNVACVFSADW